MSDPKHLTLLPANDFERRLLEAARTERPSPELTRRMADALGVVPPLSPGLPLSLAKGSLAWLSVGLITLGGALAWWAFSRNAPAREVSAARIVNVQTRAPAELAEASGPAPVAANAPDAKPSPTAMSAESPPHGAIGSPKVSATASATGGNDLKAEIRMMDAARSALVAHAPEQALTLLQRYRAAFPAGTFAQEASALRVEALEQSGQHQRAQTLAREFLARHRDSPLAERVGRVAGD